jgi:hypothetical protein
LERAAVTLEMERIKGSILDVYDYDKFMSYDIQRSNENFEGQNRPK